MVRLENEVLVEEDKRIYTLSQEKPAKAVVQMGLPLTIGMFIMVLYNLVDTFFIGLLHNDYQLAAVNLAYPVMMITMAISNMVGTGASSLIARSMGAKEIEKARHTLTIGFELTLISSIIIAALGLLFLPQLVNALGAKENTRLFTSQYVRVILIGSFFTMGNFTFGQLLRSEGSVKYSVFGMIIGTVINIILDPIFIFTFGLEITGAAIATVIGNGAGMLVSLLFYINNKTILRPSLKLLKPTVEILKEIFWVGIPATLETLLTSIAYVINNNLAVAYGELTVAAMGIAQKIMSFGSYIYQGFAAGTQPIMGYNYGAKNYKRMLAVMKAGILVTSGIELGIMCLFGIFAPVFIGIFTSTHEVVAIGCQYIRVNMLILLFVGAISMSRSTFQAMEKPQYAFTITLVRQLFLYVPLLLLLDGHFGFKGMIWAQPITELIMMVVSVTLLATKLKQYERGVERSCTDHLKEHEIG